MNTNTQTAAVTCNNCEMGMTEFRPCAKHAPESTTIHPFERVGLGKAPFRYIGQVHQDIAYGEVVHNREEWNRTGIRHTSKAGGTCAYCGNSILNMFNVKSADGNTFHVGSDCIAKVGGPALAAKVAKVVASNRKAATDKRNAEKIAAAVAALARPEVRGALNGQGHPMRKNASALDYVTWLLANAGTAGKLRAAAIIGAVS